MKERIKEECNLLDINLLQLITKISKDYHDIYVLNYFFIRKKNTLSFPFQAPTHRFFLRLPTNTEESLLPLHQNVIFFLFCFSLWFLLQFNHRSTKKKSTKSRLHHRWGTTSFFPLTESPSMATRWRPSWASNQFGYFSLFWISDMFLDLISDCLVRLSASPSTFVMFFFFSSINGSDDGGIVGERAP